ncbi:hypothetical protein [Eubacterium sp.]|uniref:hypothetical protein n=1 Tax=Eubacterium sp. TaxID=142586 RepID=UPI002FCAD316
MKLKNVEKAVKEFNKFKSSDEFYPTLMFDTSDGEVWCDVNLNGNWEEYRKDTIHKIQTMGLHYRYSKVDKTAVIAEIKNQCDELEIENEFEWEE